MLIQVIIAIVLILIVSLHSAFGKIDVNPLKLKIGVTAEDVIKRTRIMGYLGIIVGLSLLAWLFYCYKMNYIW